MQKRFNPRHQRAIQPKENQDLLQQSFAPRHQRENLLKKRPYCNRALPRAQAREAVYKKNKLNGSITFPLTKEN